jgi:hypothetical protein
MYVLLHHQTISRAMNKILVVFIVVQLWLHPPTFIRAMLACVQLLLYPATFNSAIWTCEEVIIASSCLQQWLAIVASFYLQQSHIDLCTPPTPPSAGPYWPVCTKYCIPHLQQGHVGLWCSYYCNLHIALGPNWPVDTFYCIIPLLVGPCRPVHIQLLLHPLYLQQGHANRRTVIIASSYFQLGHVEQFI